MPTGSVNINNLKDYLSFDKIVAVGIHGFVIQNLLKLVIGNKLLNYVLKL